MNAVTPREDGNLYPPIVPGEIRLLILQAGDYDQPLRGSLDVVSIVTPRPFKAVSYAWGEPTFDKILHLPEGGLTITPSLHSALRRFRDEEHAVTL